MTSLTVMFALYLYVSAIAGMQLLGATIPEDERARFTDFGVR